MIELAGNQTIIVLNSMVRQIIDLSSYLHVAEDAGTPSNIRATKKGIRAHEMLVDYIEGKDCDQAEKMWRKHLVRGAALHARRRRSEDRSRSARLTLRTG